MKLLSNIIKSSRIKVSEDNKYCLKVIDSSSTPVNVLEEFVEETPKQQEKLNSEEIIKIAQQEAQNIINDAYSQADDIINQAVADADNEIQRLKNDAQQNGYDTGYSKAISEVEVLKDKVKQELQSAQIEKQQTLEAIEPQVIRLVLQISRSIFGKMIEINPQTIILLIKKGLSESDTTGKISIHVSKLDYDNALAGKNELDEMVGGNAELEIVKDLSLAQGDCIIETPFGNVDSSFDQQFESIKSEILYILENR